MFLVFLGGSRQNSCSIPFLVALVAGFPTRHKPVRKLTIFAGEDACARLVHFWSERELLAVEGQSISILVHRQRAIPALFRQAVDQVAFLSNQLERLDRLAVILVDLGRISVYFAFDRLDSSV